MRSVGNELFGALSIDDRWSLVGGRLLSVGRQVDSLDDIFHSMNFPHMNKG